METGAALRPHETQTPNIPIPLGGLLAAGVLWLVIFLASILVLPRFFALFHSLGAPVPYLVGAVNFLQSFPGLLVQMFVGAVVVIVYCVVARSPRAARIFTRILIYGQLVIVLGIVWTIVFAIVGLSEPVN